MVVTNYIQRNVAEDARKVVATILAKRADPRNKKIRPELAYWDIASQYNGSKPKLDRQIMVAAEMHGLNGLKVLDVLQMAYENFAEQQRQIGDNRNDTNNVEAVLEALEKVTNSEGLAVMAGIPVSQKDPEREKLTKGYAEAAEAKLNSIFGGM
jgi:hypothetical protein